MEYVVHEILRKKFLDKIPTVELYSRYPGYEREIALIALSELPVDQLRKMFHQEKRTLQEIHKFKEVTQSLVS